MPSSYSKDPYWITARRSGLCAKCDAFVHPGDRVFYWPTTRDVHCAPCGDTSERRFVAEVQDEDFMGGGF